MSAWLDSAIEKGQSINDWLTPRRQSSLALLRQSKWPTRKTEDWKYTSVRPLEKRLKDDSGQSAVQNVAAIEGLNAIELHFINGDFQGLEQELPKGLAISSLSDVAEDTQAWARDLFSACKPKKHLFGLVNDTLSDNGVVIDVAQGANIETPIRIVNLVTSDLDVHNRILVRVGANAQACVIEEATGEGASYFSGFAEYFIGENAAFEHYRFCLRSAKALSIGGSHFELQSQSKLNSTIVGFGSDLARLDADVMHRGSGADAKLNAIYLLDGEETFDLHTCIEHEVPHCTTEENILGIVADRAKATFNGRIHIHRDAQKTLAELNNRNLLLSDNAQINTKPELEIYADDVRCAHGATVAELDSSALYYLTSRGVTKAKALVMLNFGFINALVDEMPNDALAEWLRPQVQQRFANMNMESLNV